MGFIMVTRVKKYCKFSDDFDWFFQLQHDSWWDSLVCRGDINCQIMLSHCTTSNNHDQSRLFLQNISRWFWGQRTDSESLFHRGCSEVENIFSWCFNKNNFSQIPGANQIHRTVLQNGLGIMEGSFEFSRETPPVRKKVFFLGIKQHPPLFSNVAAEEAKTVCPQRIWLH